MKQLKVHYIATSIAWDVSLSQDYHPLVGMSLALVYTPGQGEAQAEVSSQYYSNTCFCLLLGDSQTREESSERTVAFVGVDIVDKWFSFSILDNGTSLPRIGVCFSLPVVLWSLDTAGWPTGDLNDVMRKTEGGGVGSLKFGETKEKYGN